MSNTNPLDSLAAFAICFIAGVLMTVGLSAYINKLKNDGTKGNTLFDPHGHRERDAAKETSYPAGQILE